MDTSRFVIVTTYEFPGEPVVRNRLDSYINVLTRSGWNVVVMAVSRHAKSDDQVTYTERCDVINVPMRDYDRRNFIVRGFNELWQSWLLSRKVAQLKPDVLLITIPSIFLLLFSFRRFAQTYVCDVRDMVWEYLPRTPWHREIVRRVMEHLALTALSRSDLITISNPHELTHLKQALPSKAMLLVSNGVGYQQFHQIRKLDFESRQEKILRVTYVGNVGIAQNLTTLLEAVAGDDRFQVNIIGSGNDYERVQAFAHRNSIDNVQFRGRLSWDEAIEWYARSDVLYAQLSATFTTAMPSKLYEYLATGLPVIYGGKGAAVEILHDFSGVMIVEPDSPSALKLALQQVLDKTNTGRFPDNVKRIQQYYIREEQVVAFEKVIRNLR